MKLRVIDGGRPETRADCADVPRPCPYVGCRHNTYLDVGFRKSGGAIKPEPFVRVPEHEPDEADPATSCVLDVAEAGPASLRDVGRLLGLTREAARQIEARALEHMREEGGDLGDVVGKAEDRPPTFSRQFRREVELEAVEPEDDAPPPERDRVSFFSDDEEAVLTFMWRIYARRIGVDLRSVFSREATAVRARLRGTTGFVFGNGKMSK